MKNSTLVMALLGLGLYAASALAAPTCTDNGNVDRNEIGEYARSEKFLGWYCADYRDGRMKSVWFAKPPGDQYLQICDESCAYWEKSL